MMRGMSALLWVGTASCLALRDADESGTAEAPVVDETSTVKAPIPDFPDMMPSSVVSHLQTQKGRGKEARKKSKSLQSKGSAEEEEGAAVTDLVDQGTEDLVKARGLYTLEGEEEDTPKTDMWEPAASEMGEVMSGLSWGDKPGEAKSGWLPKKRFRKARPSRSPSPEPEPSDETPAVRVTDEPSVSPTVTTTPSPSSSVSPSPSTSPSTSTSPTPTPTVSPSSSMTPTAEPSISRSPTKEPSVSVTPPGSGTPSMTLSASESLTPSMSLSDAGTDSQSTSWSPSLSLTHSISITASPTTSPSVTSDPSRTSTTSPSVTPSESPTQSPVPLPPVRSRAVSVQPLPPDTPFSAHPEEPAMYKAEKVVDWSYDQTSEYGPETWGTMTPSFKSCSAVGDSKQSPIDMFQFRIGSQQAPLITPAYKAGQMLVRNTGQYIRVINNQGSVLYYGDQVYELVYIQIHTPGEHLMSGELFPVEVQFYHRASGSGELAALSLLYKIGPHNQFLEHVISNAPKGKDEEVLTPVSFNIGDALPKDITQYKSGVRVAYPYYTYDGSLTTPPCTEGVQWFIWTKPDHVSETQAKALRDLIANPEHTSSRFPQEPNGRVVQLKTLF